MLKEANLKITAMKPKPATPVEAPKTMVTPVPIPVKEYIPISAEQR